MRPSSKSNCLLSFNGISIQQPTFQITYNFPLNFQRKLFTLQHIQLTRNPISAAHIKAHKFNKQTTGKKREHGELYGADEER